MKRVLTVFLAAVLLLSSVCLSGCGAYRSSYMALGLVRTNGLHSASMNFIELTGTMAFMLRYKEEAGQVHCTAKLGTGEAVVYYDCGDGKKELFTVREGEEFDVVAESIEPGTVWFIVETNGKCGNGSFRFYIE